MKESFAFLLLLLVHFSLYSQAIPQTSKGTRPANDAVIAAKLIPAPNKTYGYDIFVNDQLLVHQTTIPCMSGNEGFKSKKDASKVAELVITKIRSGQMPPTVTKDELEKLGLKLH